MQDYADFTVNKKRFPNLAALSADLKQQGAVWPGKACFPDFLRPEVRAWFGGRYKTLTDCGIEGFWNDMNEPALFYSPGAAGSFSLPTWPPCAAGKIWPRKSSLPG